MGHLPEAFWGVGGRPCTAPVFPHLFARRWATLSGPRPQWSLMAAPRQPLHLRGRPAPPLPLWLSWTLREFQSCKQGLAPTFFTLTRRCLLWWVPLSSPLRERKPRLRVPGMWASLLPLSRGAGLLWRPPLAQGSRRGSPGGKVSDSWTPPTAALASRYPLGGLWNFKHV